jgi:Uncharacterized protein conserved in bacteria (DUF2252)
VLLFQEDRACDVGVVAPDVGQELLAMYDVTGVLQENVEHVELTRRQRTRREPMASSRAATSRRLLVAMPSSQATSLANQPSTNASVLEPFVARSVFPNHGQRVVIGQRLMQAASDIFLDALEAACEGLPAVRPARFAVSRPGCRSNTRCSPNRCLSNLWFVHVGRKRHILMLDWLYPDARLSLS